jgi:SWI/SNF-related matrix-associated actin-dependent regulator 1 of chromatin subfamily A
MLRRTKDAVLTELPEKTRVALPLPINLHNYWQFYRETREELLQQENPALAAVLIEKLKQFVVAEKLPLAIEWITDFVEQEKLIVFCTHIATAKTLLQKFPNAAMIIGETSQAERDAAVTRFQTDPACRLFIGNLQAAGVGLTLTAASNVAFLELGWTPGEHLQAEDRAHRIGQNYPVTIYYLLAERTIEEWIFQKLDDKRKVIGQVLTGEATSIATFSKNDMIRQLREHMRSTQ